MNKNTGTPITSDWALEKIEYNDIGLNIGNNQVMQYWEEPIMRHLAKNVTHNNGRVLEIGFGLSISARFIQQFGCMEHVIIEAHPDIVNTANDWSINCGGNVRVLSGYWEDFMDKEIGTFDGILFDTYPLIEEERTKNHFSFIEHSINLLNKDGVLTYYSDETRNFRSDHLLLMCSFFNKIDMFVVDGLEPPAECEYWKHDHMVIPSLSQPLAKQWKEK